MKYRILFGNTPDNSGKNYASYFERFEFGVRYCDNTADAIFSELRYYDFDGLVFFAVNSGNKVCELLRKCVYEYPKLKIYPIIFSDDPVFAGKLESSGAQKCMLAPLTDNELCTEIIYDFVSAKDLPFTPEIVRFINSMTALKNNTSFNYLCCVMNLAMTHPELTKQMKFIYKQAAEIMKTTPASIERSIRVVSEKIFTNGIVLNGELTHKKLSNKKLIDALIAEYNNEPHSVKNNTNPSSTY